MSSTTTSTLLDPLRAAQQSYYRSQRQSRIIYRSSTASNASRNHHDGPPHLPARIPVFQLPQHHLAVIPEDEEIRQGFYVRMAVKPSTTRRYAGLLSLSNPNRKILVTSSTTAVEYRTFSYSARAA